MKIINPKNDKHRGELEYMCSFMEADSIEYIDHDWWEEYLIKKGVPMRSGHEIVGKLVAECDTRSLKLAELSLEEFQSHCDRVEDDVFSVLGARNAVAVLSSYGSGGQAAVGHVRSLIFLRSLSQ